MTDANDPRANRSGDPDGITRLLLGTTREWFASALEAVLHSEGFSVVRAGSGDELVALARDGEPDLVIVDESLPEGEVPDLCRTLVDSALGPRIPLVIYTESYSEDRVHADALDAGAWEIFHEPIRSRVLVAALHRLLSLSRRMEPVRGDPLWDDETGFFTALGLERVLPSLGALAERRGVHMSCVVLGPTQLGRGEVLHRQRLATADLCELNVRASDVCGWLGTGELAIVTFDTTADGAKILAERLSQLAAGRSEVREDSRTLSAGVVAINGSDRESNADREAARRDASARRLEGLMAGREALRRARELGGGIRVAGVA